MKVRVPTVLVAAILASLVGASVARAVPKVTVPSDIVAEAAGPTGANVTYQASAQEDTTSTDLPISCTNPDGTTSDGIGTINPTVLFPLGETTVTCSSPGAPDESSKVTVQDTTPPTVTAPAPKTVEATGPSGAVVDYGAGSASDLVDGTVATTCAPATGSTFALGSTTVTCSATDAHNNTGSATTAVVVQDTTPPVVTPPADVTVVATVGFDDVPASTSTIAAFLNGAKATDLVDPSPVITTDAGRSFPIGTTTVTFTAKDTAGNVATAKARVKVLPPDSTPPPPPPPPPGPPPSPPPQPPPSPPAGPPPDQTPPAEASSFKVKAGDHSVTATWKLPNDADFDHVVLVRSTARSLQADKVVYSGRGTRYTDRKLSNDVPFRYTLATVDTAGNRSDGVATTATPHTINLVSPSDGARLSAPPTLVWVPSSKATYYNVQLFRGSTKILSAWPSRNQFRVSRQWRYRGQRYRLQAGTYHWYVWPGLGPRRAAKYGPVLGQSSFVYAPG